MNSVELKKIGMFYQRLDLHQHLENSSKDTDFANVIKKVGDFERNCLLNFAQSILSGEYVFNPNSVRAEITKLKNILPFPQYPKETDSKKIKIANRIIEHNQWFCEMLNEYEEHILDTENRLEIYDYSLHSKADDTTYPRTSQYASIYLIILSITRIDCFFEYHSSYVRKVLQYRELLRGKTDSNKKIDLLYRILEDKCTLLLKKLESCANHRTTYAVDSVIAKVDLAKETTTYFKNLEEQCVLYNKQRYEKEESIRDIQKKFDKTPGDLSFGELMLLLKYFKDFKNVPKKHIESILELFDKRVRELDKKKSLQEANTFCIDTLRHYVKNCELSLKMKQPNFSVDELVLAIDEINALEMSTAIYDFYPYKKALSYLHSIVKGDVTAEYEAEKVKLLLQKYDNDLRNSLEWCDKRSFFPINLPYEECLTRIPNWDSNIYTPSSYCRAIDYKEEFRCYQNLHLETVVANNRIEMQQEHANVEALRKDYKNAIGKNLETMSIFSAVIVFLFGCVNFLSLSGRLEGFSSRELLFDTAMLGTILLLFSNMILVWTMSRGDTWKDFFNTIRSWLLLISSIIYVVIIALGFRFCYKTLHTKSVDSNMSLTEQLCPETGLAPSPRS